MSRLDDNNSSKTVMIVSTALMGLIAIATAWSGFQAAKWGGQMSNYYAAANSERSTYVLDSLFANQEILIDVHYFTEWVDAVNAGESELAEYYLEIMRAEFVVAMDAWLAKDPRNNPQAPSSPFLMPEYVLEIRKAAVESEALASSFIDQAHQANKTSDNYLLLTTVIFASALFFAGISTRFQLLRFQFIVLVMSVIAFLFGIIVVSFFPVLI